MSAASTASVRRLVPVPSVTSTSASTSSLVKRLPSSLSPSRPSTLSSSTRPRSTRPLLVVSVSPLYDGTVRNATTMPWLSTFSALPSRTSSTFATASSRSRLSCFSLIRWYVYQGTFLSSRCHHASMLRSTSPYRMMHRSITTATVHSTLLC